MRYVRSSLLVCVALLFNVSAAAPWRLALVTDMSGVAANGGQAILEGLELAVSEINSDGGLLGRPLQVDVVDHRGNPARAVAGLKPLLDDEDLLTVIGGVQSHVALATLPMIQEKPIVMLNPWATADKLTVNDYETKYVFRLSVRDEWAAEFILSEMEKEQCGIVSLMVNLNGWGRSNERAMTAASEKSPLTIQRTEWLAKDQERVPELVDSLMQDNTDCLVLITGNKEALTILTTLASYPDEQRPRVYSHWSLLGGAFVDNVSDQTLDKVALRVLSTLQFNSPKTQQGEDLISLYKQTYGDIANAQTFHAVAHSYDLMRMFAQAVRAADSSTQDDIRQAMVDLLDFDGVMKKYITPFKSEPMEALDASDYILVPFRSLSAVN